MLINFEEKVVLITGASQGIGKAIADQFFQQGSFLILVSRSIKNFDQNVIDHPNSLIVEADVTTPQGVRRVNDAVSSLNRNLDVLICNVGSGSSSAPGLEIKLDWIKAFDVNFFSSVEIISSLKKYLSRTEGSVVCISSICGERVIKHAPITYSAAKAALNAYIKGMSIPLSEVGIRINGIAPGNILHENSVWHLKQSEDQEALQEYLDKEVVLRRLGSANEVAKMALWLASDNMGFATGTIYKLDGGQIL
ncbi:SDR family oxidoreductase [Pseudomonadales bacterium]|nr:SDR family oxidoreductase [Pseudomonadales bacterium]